MRAKSALALIRDSQILRYEFAATNGDILPGKRGAVGATKKRLVNSVTIPYRQK